MKKTYSIFINVLLVILFNLFFIAIVKNIVPSNAADAEILASVISTVAPNGTYYEQVSVAQSVLNLSDDSSLQATVNKLGTFTKPISSTARRAAQEAISQNKSSQ